MYATPSGRSPTIIVASKLPPPELGGLVEATLVMKRGRLEPVARIRRIIRLRYLARIFISREVARMAVKAYGNDA